MMPTKIVSNGKKTIQRAWHGWKNNKNHIQQRIVALILLAFMAINVATVAFAENGATDDEGNASNYSFSSMSSTAAAAFSTAIGDAEDASTAVSTQFSSVTSSSAGGLLGFPDDDQDRSIIGLWFQALTNNSKTMSYDSFGTELANKAGGGSSSSSVFAPYITLGASLSAMGLDKTSTNISAESLISKRGLAGSVTKLVYMLTLGVDILFGFVIDALKALNPFQLFRTIPVIAGNTFTSHVNSIPSGWLSSSYLTAFISNIYTYLYYFGIVIIVVSFGVFLIKFFLGSSGVGNKQKGQESRLALLKQWVIKSLFIIGGIAILGGTYTATLDMLSDSLGGGTSAASKVVASTFFDFEGWVYTGMNMDGVSINAKYKDGAFSQGSTDVQSTTYNLNQKVNTNLPSSLGSGSDMSNVNDVASLMNLIDGETLDSDSTVTSTNVGTNDVNNWCLDMLSRYSNGDKVYASDYESSWKAKNWSSNDASKALSLIFKDFMSNVSNFQAGLESGHSTTFANNIVWQADGISVKDPFAGGTGCIVGTQQSGASSYGTSMSRSSTASTKYAYSSNIGGMSAMSIYNYLNTTFGPTQMITYSSALSMSNYTRDTHYSVNLVGNGSQSIIYLGVCLTMLATYSILGIFYGFGIILTNIKRGIRLIVAVPGAMLGSLQSIAKVVSYTLLMIVEVVVNIMLYVLTTELLYVIGIKVTNQAATNLSALGLTTDVAAVICGLLSMAILIWFTKMAISIRKPLIKSVEEMADNAVQKFITGTSAAEMRAAAAQNGGNGQAAAAGAGAGAGTAAARRKSNWGRKMDAKKAENDAKGAMLVSQMGLAGNGSSSALEESNNLDNLAAARRENRKMTRKEKQEAGKKAVVGAAEVAAGAYTGNAAIMARGAQNLAQSSKDAKNADINQHARNAELTAAAAKANGANTAGLANASTAMARDGEAVKSFDMKKEAGAVALAGVGGEMAGSMGQAANASNLAGAGSQAASAGSGAAQISGDGATSAIADKLGNTPKLDTAIDAEGTATVNSKLNATQGSKTLSNDTSNLVGGHETKMSTSNIDELVQQNKNSQMQSGGNKSLSKRGGNNGSEQGTSETTTATDNFNVIHQQNVQAVASGNRGAIVSSNNAPAPQVEGGQQGGNDVVTTRRTVTNEQVVDTASKAVQGSVSSSNVSFMGGSAAGTAIPKGDASHASIENTQTVDVKDNVQMNKSSGGNVSVGSAGGSVPQGTSSHATVENVQNVDVKDDVKVNHGGSVQGFSASRQQMNFSGSQSHQTVRNTTTVTEETVVQSGGSSVSGSYAGGGGTVQTPQGRNSQATVRNTVTYNTENVGVQGGTTNTGYQGGSIGGGGNVTRQGSQSTVTTRNTTTYNTENHGQVGSTIQTGSHQAGGNNANLGGTRMGTSNVNTTVNETRYDTENRGIGGSQRNSGNHKSDNK